MFASPVAYPSDLVPARWRWLYGLNPMAGVIEGFRWSLTGRGKLPSPLLASLLSTPWSCRASRAASPYFHKMEATIADVV